VNRRWASGGYQEPLPVACGDPDNEVVWATQNKSMPKMLLPGEDYGEAALIGGGDEAVKWRKR
jgi:hypothetical protein